MYLIITFDWRVLLTKEQRVWTTFCKIFSGTPHLTVFGAPKYAYSWFNTKKCFRGRQFLCPHPSGSDRRRRDWSDRLRRLTAVPFFVHSSTLLICFFGLMYFRLLKGRRDGWLLLKKLATHGYKIWSHKAAVFCQLQPSSRKRRVISWKRPKSVYLLTWAGWIQNGDRIFVKAGPMFCGFWSTRIQNYFPLSSSVHHRRDSSTFLDDLMV